MQYFEQEVEKVDEDIHNEEDNKTIPGGYDAGCTTCNENYGQDPDGIDYLFQ